jgi:hypothetical protein
LIRVHFERFDRYGHGDSAAQKIEELEIAIAGRERMISQLRAQIQALEGFGGR